MIDERRRIAVAVAVIVCEQSVVVSTRRESGVLDGLMEFPGGRVEPGETPESAARRELFEETGIAAPPLTLFEQVDHDYADRSLSLFFFVGKVPHEGPLSTPWRWCPIATLGDMPAANRPVVESLRQGIPPFV